MQRATVPQGARICAFEDLGYCGDGVVGIGTTGFNVVGPIAASGQAASSGLDTDGPCAGVLTLGRVAEVIARDCGEDDGADDGADEASAASSTTDAGSEGGQEAPSRLDAVCPCADDLVLGRGAEVIARVARRWQPKLGPRTR